MEILEKADVFFLDGSLSARRLSRRVTVAPGRRLTKHHRPIVCGQRIIW